MSTSRLNHSIQEFWSNVWDHTRDPFQVQFDDRRSLLPNEISALQAVVEATHGTNDDQQLASTLRSLIRNHDPQMIELFLQIAGLTRNKILTDLRAISTARGLKLGGTFSHLKLVDHDDTWSIAGPYLAGRLRRVLGLPPTEILEALNQATYPGYIRQERAKRQGHEAEYRLAIVLLEAGINFVPKSKAENPLSSDAQLNGVSFDLVIPDLQQPLVCTKATVHTANIGQYGESKDALEIAEAREMIDSHFQPSSKPLLLALIDGVGFTSNRAGLERVLDGADEFCQFRTIWKAIVICASLLGKDILIELPESSRQRHSEFLRKYDYESNVRSGGVSTSAVIRVPIGEGYLLRE